LSRAEGLEEEHIEMQGLCLELKSVEKTSDMKKLEEARRLIAKLRSMNQRWNIKELNAFIKERQRELFF